LKAVEMESLRKTLSREDVAPLLRRSFINTLFDSTFMLLGIVVGVAYASEAGLRAVALTMATSSLALGISTGVSVYESERIEREKAISELERALFRDLNGTWIERSAKSIALLLASVNFFTPLLSCMVTISPFAFVALKAIGLREAAWASIALALGTLFAAGAYMGKIGHRNPWMRGLRMAGFGLMAFAVGFLLDSLA
jgi:predicted membrane protein (TIGR00267 family)